MLNVTFDHKDLSQALGRFADQTPYVLSTAINSTLVDVQTSEVAHANDVFTIRRQAFLKRSMKITKFAKKHDLIGTIEVADVGAKNTSDIFDKFETGKTKTANGGHHVAIPTRDIKTSKSGVIPAARRPANLPRAFKLTTRVGQKFIVQSKKRRGKDSLQFLYALMPSVRIDRRLRFVDTGMKTIDRVASQNLNAAIERAIRTARL